MRYRIIPAIAAFALLTAVDAPARAQERGPGQKIGGALDEAGKAVRRGAMEVGDNVREGYAKAKASVNAMGVESRVYGRLKWDKALVGSAIDVTVAKDGTTTLTGSVLDAEGKLKAVKVAGETVGVTRVLDQLVLGTATPVR